MLNCLPPIFQLSYRKPAPTRQNQPDFATASLRVSPSLPNRSLWRTTPWASLKDTLHLSQIGKTMGLSASRSATYRPKVATGTYGLPPSHMYSDCFKTKSGDWNPPGVAKVVSVTSLDPETDDPTKAYASEIIVDLKDTKLNGKTTPGEHLSLLDISNPQIFKPDFIQNIQSKGCDYQFTKQDFEHLGNARLKNFTIASPVGGERDAYGRPNGRVKLIVRRVEYKDEGGNLQKGSMTNYLASRRPGDPLVFAAPISHHFLGPKAATPAIFFGVGTSITPYEGMLRTRFEQEKGPYADTYLAIGHTKQALEYDRELLEGFAQDPNHHFTYQPVFSREPEKSGGINYVQKLIQDPAEAKKIFALVLNPKAHIYISGFFGFDQQLFEALKKSTHANPQLGVTEQEITHAWKKAEAENRLHREGEIRRDLTEGLQGY